MAFALRGAAGHPADLESIGIVPQDHQLAAASQRHRSCHVEVAPHVAARVVVAVLVLANFKQDGAPGRQDYEVDERALRLRGETARRERQIVLIFEFDPGFAQELVDLQLLALRHGLGVVAVEGSYMYPEGAHITEAPIIAVTLIT